MTTTASLIPLIERAKQIFVSNNNPSNCFITNKYLRRAKESRRDDLPGVVCYVIAKHTKNGLGIDDTQYYYLIARDYWYYQWADIDHANVSKYKNSPGGGLDAEIAKHMVDLKTIGISWLVVAIPNKHYNDKLEFWCIPASLFKELVDKHSTLHRGRFSHTDYGYSKEWLTMLT